MKNLLFLFAMAFTLSCCSKDDNKSPNQLPPETQTGANTFGVTINGKVYVPRDPTGVSIGPTAKGMIFLGCSR